MGYYTDFEITITENDEPISIGDTLKISRALGFPGYEREPGFIVLAGAKWYHCDKEIKEVSLRYPKYEFHITGEGEEFPDIWHAKAKNGRFIRKNAEITYPEIVWNDKKKDFE